jgi:energy-converting hydrogenase Eha subunit C
MSLATLALRPVPSLPWLIPACGLLAIAETSRWIDIPMVGGALKPLTTLLILLHAATLSSADLRLRRRVLAGLSLSFLGECAFAVPAGFLLGACFFILALCAYLAALKGAAGGLARPGPMHLLHALVVTWALTMWSVRPPAVFLLMIVFFCLLGLLSAQADKWWWRARGTPEAATARRAAVGALLWLLADLLVTYSQFVQWIPATLAMAMTLYWLAQWNLVSIIRTAVRAPTSGH